MCGCSRTTSTLTASAQTLPAGVKYRVEYPNGANHDFDHEWQAVQAQARSGGTVRIVPPGFAAQAAATATPAHAGT